MSDDVTNEARLRILRIILVLDAAVLLLLGALFVFAPQLAALAFNFNALPDGVYYMIRLWGCALFSMGIGYGVAVSDPVRHAVWVQIGIVRGALEFFVGLFYLLSGIVSWQQGGFGLVAAGAMVLAYIAFYPRPASRALASSDKERTGDEPIIDQDAQS